MSSQALVFNRNWATTFFSFLVFELQNGVHTHIWIPTLHAAPDKLSPQICVGYLDYVGPNDAQHSSLTMPSNLAS